MPGVRGLIFFGFRSSGRLTVGRLLLTKIQVPMLFVQGTRDAFAT